MTNTDCSFDETPLNEIETLAISTPLRVFGRAWAASSGTSYLHSATKRCLDIAVAAALLAVLMPLLLLVLICVKLTSNGPAIFTQARTGFDGNIFDICKFRTMYTPKEVPCTFLQTRRGDPRITPFGHFIRRTSIDELPQLWNVLQGDMSLVGPRPHARQHDGDYLAEHPDYARRFAAKPGMTGLAQINGSRGAIEDENALRVRLDFDFEYVEKASFLLDIKLLTLTLKEVVFSRGAF